IEGDDFYGKDANYPGLIEAVWRRSGEMNGVLMDVHGAGCQRSDPKTGDKNAFPKYLGPQGDV
ncbi:hypothetical protein, partial [Marinilabilia salmonicolor]|uniref:hypothetical protein n=1 Tax=Marinilabilia salmonicolor TaxID=989 RepID=UPI000685445A